MDHGYRSVIAWTLSPNASWNYQQNYTTFPVEYRAARLNFKNVDNFDIAQVCDNPLYPAGSSVNSAFFEGFLQWWSIKEIFWSIHK